MEQDALRLIVRRKLAQSDLPHDSIPRSWGGPANDEACDACEETIGREQFNMEGISFPFASRRPASGSQPAGQMITADAT